MDVHTTRLCVLLVDQNVPVSGITLLHVDNGLVGILHVPLLDPRLDLLLGSELKHLVDLPRSTNGATSNLDARSNEGERIDSGKSACVGGTNLDESSLDLEQLKVLAKRHLVTGDGADNQVERASIMLGPVLIVVGRNVSVGTELKDLILFAGLARDSNDLIGAKSLGEKNAEVSETTNTNDTNFLARSTTILLERRVDSHSTAEHGSGSSRADALGDLKNEMAWRAVVVGVSTIRFALVVGVNRAVGINGVNTVRLQTIGALITVRLQARICLSTNTDAIADLDVLDVLANSNGLANDFVANAACCCRSVVIN